LTGAGGAGAARGTASRLSRAEHALRAALAAVATALRVIEGEGVRLRAMALTYLSLFALVPGLVVAFSVVQVFTGGMQRVGDRVHEFLLANLAVGARTTIEPYLDRFIANAHVASAGLVGGLLLVWSAVTLFSTVEGAVNDIWGIRRRRGLAQQAAIYWVGLTLGPLLLAGSVGLGAWARAWLVGTSLRFLASVGEVLLTCAFFAVLYQLVPNTRVRPYAAAAAGLVAGVAWELAKSGYTFAVAKIFRYHAIYGSVAAVPIFLLWLFLSWTILLFGARLAYLIQYAPLLRTGGARGAGREVLAGQAMLQVARAFDRGEPPPDAGEVASRLSASAEEAGDCLTALRQHGLLVAAADGGLVPARPIEKISLLDVRRALLGADLAAGGVSGPIVGVFRDLDAYAAERLDAVSFRELCDLERGAAPSDQPLEGRESEHQPVTPDGSITRPSSASQA